MSVVKSVKFISELLCLFLFTSYYYNQWVRYLSPLGADPEVQKPTTPHSNTLSSSHLKVESLHVSQGLKNLGGHSGGQHIDSLSVCWTGMVLLPVKEHPPSKQSRQLVTCEHLPTRPETQTHTHTHTQVKSRVGHSLPLQDI